MIFILIFLSGWSLVRLLSRDFKLTEELALAMPIGLGLTSFLMFFINQLTHSITWGSVVVALLIATLLLMSIRLYLDFKANDLPWKRLVQKPDFSWLTLVWVVFASMITYLVYGILTKCMYWPPAEFDTIEGYDLLSKAIAREHILANSILTNKDIVTGCGPRLLYPPLLALCNSICYMTGMETPKLINALFFLSWVFIIYLLLRRFVTSTAAILFTLLIIVVPEMFAHASFSLTNLPCAIYSSTAVISFVIWYEQRKEGFFYLSFVTIIFSSWTRSEAVLFVVPIMMLLFYRAIKEKQLKYLLIYGTTVLPYIVWTLFLKANLAPAQTHYFNTTLTYNSVKLTNILAAAWGLMCKGDIYGLTFQIFIGFIFIGIIINIIIDFKRNKYIVGGLILWIIVAMVLGIHIFTLLLFCAVLFAACIVNEEHWTLLAIFFVALAGYTTIYYQVSDTDASLFAPGGWMQSGYKRGLFCYAPLALFYVATSKWVIWLSEKLDKHLVLFAKPPIVS